MKNSSFFKKMIKRSKFNVGSDKEKRTYGDIVFDSMLEMTYYKDVVLPGIKDGLITKCDMQKKYVLQPGFLHEGKKILPIDYKADFYLEYKDGKKMVVDIKGCPSPDAKLKRKMFWYVYPELNYVWIGYSKIDGGWVTYEKIVSGRKERKKIKEIKGKKG